ncbi:MAG: orotate phosphoribosyltransferase [Dehalococcoidia bacterium]|nr:orotate phosphoribosyltransferase [Dehalococcoidia bacterium]
MTEAVPVNPEAFFRQSGAVLDGHFLLTSGLHSPVYWEKFRILEHPEYTQALCSMIAGYFTSHGIEAVVGPTTGGIILAYEVARQLGVRCIFAEKEESGRRAFRRGFMLKHGERVLVVDDILTTGKSVCEVLAALAEHQAAVAGVAVLVDRSEHGLDFGCPLYATLRSVTPAYKPEECPLCHAGIPLTKPGSSKQSLK